MCVCGIKGVDQGVVRGRGGASTVTFSTGLEWREVCILAQRAILQVRVLLQFDGAHILVLYIVQYCFNTVYFSPLQVKINHMMYYEGAFILGSVSMATST
jgi:hypothetical protein